MKNNYFLACENLKQGDTLPLDETLDHLAFNDQGLIPVIVQDNQSRQILMMAWMTRESISLTLSTGKMTYWSRSRNSLWIKGETSGNTQELVEMHLDCDGDAVLCYVNQTGPACHTNRDHCFYLQVDKDNELVRISDSVPQE